MSETQMVSVRLPTETKQRVEEYADENNINRSDAIRMLLDKAVDLERGELQETPAEVVVEALDAEAASESDAQPWWELQLQRVGALLAAFSVLVFLGWAFLQTDPGFVLSVAVVTIVVNGIGVFRQRD